MVFQAINKSNVGQYGQKHKSHNKMCTAFPKHIYVWKLCMYIHHPT